MKNFFVLIVALTCMLLSSTALAGNQANTQSSVQYKQTSTLPRSPQEKISTLPKVGVIYVNAAHTTYNKRIDKFVQDNLHECINGSSYQFIDGTTFIKKLYKYGLQDLSTAERADIIDALHDENLDYLVYLKIEPITTKSKATVFSKGKSAVITAPFKVIDMKNNRTLYNGEITEQGKTTVMMGKIGNKSVALEGVKRVNNQVKQILAERLPK